MSHVLHSGCFRVAVLVALLGTGCGYQKAMQRAEEAQAQKDWAAAATAYEAALAHDPDDLGAAKGLADVRRRWHTQSLNRFEKALSTGQIEAANAALNQAEAAQPGANSNVVARSRLKTAVQARHAAGLRIEAQAHRARQDLPGALKRYAKAQALHPTPKGQTALDATRTALEVHAAQAKTDGRWAIADAAWREIVAVAPTAQPQRDALRADWIAAWRADAEAHKTQPAFAFVRWAQVAALSGAPADAARRDALRARLSVPAQLRTALSLQGPTARQQRIEARMPTPMSTHTLSPALALNGQILPVDCAQTEQVEVRSERYQSGTRRARNPEWDRAQRVVRRRRSDRDRAEDDWQTADRAQWKAEQTLTEQRQRLADQVRRERQRLREKLRRARQEEARCQDAVRDAQPAQRSNARYRLQAAQLEVDRAWKALEAVSEDVPDRALYALKNARDAAERARRDRQSARDDLADAERALDRIQPTIEEPVYATHRFPVSRWTRRCTARVQLTVQLSDNKPETVELKADAQTHDRSHRAQVVLGLGADPLRFPKNDLTLAQTADRALAEKLGRLVAQQRTRWRRRLVARAQNAATPQLQVQYAVQAALAGSQHDAMHHILRDRLALEDVSVLTP